LERAGGEIPPGYLKRIASVREASRQLNELINPNTNSVTSDEHEKRSIAQFFYSQLYSPDPIEETAVNDLLSCIPEDIQLTEDDREALMNKLTLDDILEENNRSPKTQ
jgi:hypothetical protein